MQAEDVIGAVWSPDDGRVGPSDLCAALAKGVRARGARICEDTAVTGILTDGGRITGVETDRGAVRCDAIALCAGLWSRKVASMANVEVPVWPCEHFYLLTKPIDGIEGNLPTLSDHDGRLYIRDDSGGLLIGCFEPMGKAIAPGRLGGDFAFRLLPENWDHFEPMMLNALHRLPALETAQVRMLLNGPESFTPDGAFLLGEAAETRGLFLGCGMNMSRPCRPLRLYPHAERAGRHRRRSGRVTARRGRLPALCRHRGDQARSGLAEATPGRRSMVAVGPEGNLMGHYDKLHIAQFGASMEKEYFRRGKHLLVFEINGFRIAPIICYDIRMPELTRTLCQDHGVHLVLHCGAYARDESFYSWHHFAVTRAMENQCFLASINRAGDFFGESIVCSPWVNEDRPPVIFGTDEEFRHIDLGMEELDSVRANYPFIPDKRDDYRSLPVQAP